MAIREQKGRARPFFVYWTNPFTKKRESRSCETRAEAEKLDAFVKYQLKYERESFRPLKKQEEKGAEEQELTFEGAMYLYLKDRKFSEKALARFLKNAKKVLTLCRDVLIKDMSRDFLQNVVDTIFEDGKKSGATVKRQFLAIGTVLNWCFKHDLLQKPYQKPTLPKVRTEKFIPPTPSEIAAMFAVSPPYVQRVLVFGFYVGCRVGPSEMFRLRWQDVDFSQAVVHVPNADKGAMEPWRDVPISQKILALLLQWHDQDKERGIEDIFLNTRGKKLLCIRHAIWKKILVKSGITRHLRPYDLRHGFATQLIACGADVGTVAQLMGHANATMVLTHYQHVLTAQKKAAIESLPGF